MENFTLVSLKPELAQCVEIYLGFISIWDIEEVSPSLSQINKQLNECIAFAMQMKLQEEKSGIPF